MRNCHPRLRGSCRKPDTRRSRARVVGLREADDSAIWTYAETNGLVLLTKDEDFAMRTLQGSRDR